MPLTRDEVIETLKTHDNVIFLTTGNEKKRPELERLIGDPNKPVLTLLEIGALLGIEGKDAVKATLESSEGEKGYEEIAKGKVSHVIHAIREAEKAGTLNLPRDLLAKMTIVGDDYGAAASALRFTYDAHAPEFTVQFDADGHISQIGTNRPELANQPAPGYFSKRVIHAVAEHRGLDPKADGQKAFDALAAEIFHAADKQGDRKTTATVAIAYGKPTDDTIHVSQVTQNYELVASGKMPDKGFDFDRIQALGAGQPTIAEWPDAEKDANFPRGIAVRKAMEEAFGKPAEQLKQWERPAVTRLAEPPAGINFAGDGRISNSRVKSDEQS
jgi:inosine/xanthosine triphosphate pyrophosphatase family protein